MNEIDELTQLVTEAEPEPAADNSPLRNSTFAYHAVVIILDIISGFIVGFMTYPVYGFIWFAAGAASFFQHHKNWENPDNNEKQLSNSTIGLIVSVSAVVAMALISGAVLILNKNNLLTIPAGYVSMFVELLTVSLFCWNGLQFAMYRFNDDSFKTNRQIAKAKATANKKIEFARAAGSVVSANQRFIDERNLQRMKHGGTAVDAALSKLQGTPAMTANAAEVDGVEIDPKAQAGKPQE